MFPRGQGRGQEAGLRVDVGTGGEDLEKITSVGYMCRITYHSGGGVVQFWSNNIPHPILAWHFQTDLIERLILLVKPAGSAGRLDTRL